MALLLLCLLNSATSLTSLDVSGMKEVQGAVLSKLCAIEVFNFLQLHLVAAFEAQH